MENQQNILKEKYEEKFNIKVLPNGCYRITSKTGAGLRRKGESLDKAPYSEAVVTKFESIGNFEPCEPKIEEK